MFQTLVVGIALFGAVGDILLYRGARSSALLLSLGVLSWLMSLLLFAELVRRTDTSLSVAFIVTAAAHILFVVAYDLLIQRAHLSTLETAGLAVTILGILLIESGDYVREWTAHRSVMTTSAATATVEVAAAATPTGELVVRTPCVAVSTR